MTEHEPAPVLDIPEGAKDLCARITGRIVKYGRKHGTAPTFLYLGSAEWQELRFFYGRYPQVYGDLQVVLVREHNWLRVGD